MSDTITTLPGTSPDELRRQLRVCHTCNGCGTEPFIDGITIPCAGCNGGGFTGVEGDLGPSRTYPKGRPFNFMPGTGELTIARGKHTTDYSIKEFTPDGDGRAFEFLRQNGEREGEVYHVLALPNHIGCDCAGRTYGATAKADQRAHFEGRERYGSTGCIHADAVRLFLAAGLFDLPKPAHDPVPEIEMLPWQRAWREGFAPLLSTRGLTALATALRNDDPRLAQGCTTTPPPLMCVQDWPVECACGLAFIGAIENGGFLCTAEEYRPAPPQTNRNAARVGQVEEFFAKLCFDADQLLGEQAGCRYFLNYFDDTPRDQMRAELLTEIELVLSQRTES